MGARWPEGGQEGAWQHPGIAAGGNWREPGEAGAGAGQGPGFTLNPLALVPTSARHIKHKTSFFEHSSAKWTSWGLGKLFFTSAGPRTIPKRAIIDERGSKISEDLIYFCDSGSPFSEKMCQNCCKGCQILMSRYLLPAATGS